jgi:hypothetical protein
MQQYILFPTDLGALFFSQPDLLSGGDRKKRFLQGGAVKISFRHDSVPKVRPGEDGIAEDRSG